MSGDHGWDLNILGYLTFWKDEWKGNGGGVVLLSEDETSTVARTDLESKDLQRLPD